MTFTHEFLHSETVAPLLAALHKECFAPAWNEKTFSDLLALPTTTTQLLCRDVTPIGFCLYQITHDEAEILTLGILPEKRGSSCGALLLERGQEYLSNRNVRRLLLEVSEKNIPARRLYEKAGFSEIARRKGYYRDETGRVDALIFEMTLHAR